MGTGGAQTILVALIIDFSLSKVLLSLLGEQRTPSSVPGVLTLYSHAIPQKSTSFTRASPLWARSLSLASN